MIADERREWSDAETGLRVTRWTGGPSNHLYFTNPGWFDSDRQLLIAVDRDGRTQFDALDLASGARRPVTSAAPGVHPFQAAVDGIRDRAVAWAEDEQGQRLDLIDLGSGIREVLYRLPEGWEGIIPNIAGDGSRVCFGMTEATPDLHFAARFVARPRSRICCLDLATRDCRIVHERDRWLGHVNTAPGDPELLSFCHEGPWTKVEHRVWCCDLRDGRVWKVHAEMREPACIGHEYWLADGRRIAYHGFDDAARPVLGIVDVHDGSAVEHRQPVKTRHSHSLDGRLIVGDGSEALPWIMAWLLDGDGLDGPFKICHHGGGWSEQRVHVHPRIAPDGRSVLFTSDAGGIPRVHSVELPEDIASLPRLVER